MLPHKSNPVHVYSEEVENGIGMKCTKCTCICGLKTETLIKQGRYSVVRVIRPYVLECPDGHVNEFPKEKGSPLLIPSPKRKVK